MTLQEFVQAPGSKFAVIRKESYDADPIAQSISASPRIFEYAGVEMVVLSIEPSAVETLAAYAGQAANGVEFELTVGSGKVTLLTHEHALSLIASE